MDSYTPTTGALRDLKDNRDFLYQDVLGAEIEGPDWEKGYHLFEELGLPLLKEDQGRSYSCVGQATAQHTRAWRKKLFGQDIQFSAKFIYSQISLGMYTGAYIRDGVKLVASLGVLPEELLRSYEESKAPSEPYMFERTWVNQSLLDAAKPFDTFTYRMIPGSTANISLFAHAIRNNCGVVGGFTGTNAGWTRDLIRYPQGVEERWGHCVKLMAYGMYQDKKCVFTPNSWGSRYTIKEGRWKGLQAIPVDYFEVAPQTAVGPAPGGFVFNGWVLVPDSQLTPQQRTMDFLKKNEGRLVQDVQGSGAFGLVRNGQILVASRDRVPELIATYIMRKEGVAVPKELWNDSPKADL